MSLRLVVLVLALLAVPPVTAQSGSTSDCVDAVTNTIVGGLLSQQRRTPLSAVVTVAPLTGYEVDSAGRVILAFYSAEGRLLRQDLDAHLGVVPEGADHATLCVQATLGAGGMPLAHPPALFESWSYRDGL